MRIQPGTNIYEKCSVQMEVSLDAVQLETNTLVNFY